jgi:uncharacterized protein YbbC (DUF1343 family)
MIKLGIENQTAYHDLLKDRRIGLITNPTGVDSKKNTSIDLLNQSYKLTTLFGPEHGVRGAAQAGVHVGDDMDEKTGCPMYSLYGKNRKPTKEMLTSVDVLCFDIQDVGARFYTYIYTMAYAMMAAKEEGLPFVVFDRPNPLGGIEVEGVILDTAYRSFVGYYPMVQRYGLTIGELALMFNDAFEIGCDLHVIPMIGWKREFHLKDLDLPWIPPSPNIPTPETMYVYLGTCLFEGTNISEGRGTTKPFSMIGAPWLNAKKTIETLNQLEFPGVHFIPTTFMPTFSKHKDHVCHGIEIVITDHFLIKPVQMGYLMLDIIRKSHLEFEFLPPYKEGMHPMIDLLTGSDHLRTQKLTIDQLMAKMTLDAHFFENLKQRYHLYE